jgi:hypothetical protein
VAIQDDQSKPDADLLAAAEAAASWARARRAAWTDEPLPVITVIVDPPPRIEGAVAPAVDVPSARPVAIPPVVVPPPVTPPVAATPVIAPPVAAPQPAPQPLAAQRSIRDSDRPPVDLPAIGRWAALAVASVAVAAGVVVGARYIWRALPAFTARETKATSSTLPPRPTVGLMHVTSTPDGARVLVDGKDRGVTPLTIADLAPGVHHVAIASSTGTVQRDVRIVANETAEVDEQIFAGFVTVLAPFVVQISENGRAFSVDDRDQIMLPPGMHNLRIANPSLDFVTVQRVQVKPGESTTVRVMPPTSALIVISAQSAEIWLDGARIGETPLPAVPTTIGTHQVVVKRGGAERAFTITVGTKPYTLDADASR